MEKEIDVCGFQEIGINWRNCRGKGSLRERMKYHGWEYSRIVASYNKNCEIGKHQYGGTMTFMKDQITHRVSASGIDESGLGRWSWIQLKGSNNHKARIITVYQPNVQKDPLHSSSVYQQQKRYHIQKGKDTCPNELLRNDLEQMIQTCRKKGEKIVVLIDCNEDVRNGSMDQMLRKNGLRSAIRQKFGDMSAPPTHHRGSVPIDDIYLSHDLNFIRAGYLAFGDGPGDHRGLFIDIGKQNLLGGDIHSIHRQQARRLVSSDKKCTDRFNRLFEHQLNRNHVIERMNKLNKICHNELTNSQLVEYESLDRFYVEAFKYADKRCRKLKAGQIGFAPEEIQIEARKMHLWTLCIRKHHGCNVSSKLIKRLAKQLKIKRPMQIDIELMVQYRLEAKVQYEDLKPNSKEIRDRWLEKKALNYYNDGENKLGDLISRMRRIEDLRDSHKKIKLARGNVNSSGTMKLVIPNLNGEGSQEITDKEEIEEILMHTNKTKFQQANETPLVCHPLDKILGPNSMTIEAEGILNGSVKLTCPIHPGAEDFLMCVPMDDRIKSKGAIPCQITEQEHVRFWKKARESTQSSISGLHFGFYKTTAKIAHLARLATQFINIPFRTGYASWRHKGDLNVTLQKKEGCYDPKKQRTIHLLEADFSEGCKMIFSKRMMNNARRCDQIPEEQYARKGGKSIDAAFHKVLTLDHMRLLRRSGIGFASDLMNCYDRMTHASGALALRTLGVPGKAVECLSNTVQGMRNHIRTAYGDSMTYYTGSIEEPLQGGGQGNPAAPPMWTALSIIILRVLELYDPGVTIMTSISLAITIYTAIMYVDDTDMFSFGHINESAEDLLQRTQFLALRWCDALWATGGALRPEKCWWYFVRFTWQGSKWKYMPMEDNPGIMWVPDSNGTETMINRVEYNCPMRTLGVRLAADGNMTGEYEYLLQQSVKWATKLKKAYLYRSEACLALVSTISKTWSYPLQCTTFSLQECEEIMLPVYKTILPKMGVIRTINTIYRYVPKHMNGLGLPHIYTEQGIAHIQTFLSHMNTTTKLGHLMMAQIQSCSIELGSTKILFHLDYQTWSPLLTNCWTKSLWRFVKEYNINLQGKYDKPTKVCERDEGIMDVLVNALTSNNTTEDEILIINRCRLYLQIVTLSDICCSDGLRIDHDIYVGERNEDRKSRWIWPEQARPNTKEWETWKRTIDIIIQPYLQKIGWLGKWTEKSHQEYKWWVGIDNKSLYHLTSSTIEHYSLTNRHRSSNRTSKYKLVGACVAIPSNTNRTSVQNRYEDLVWITGHRNSINTPLVENNCNWWSNVCRTVSKEVEELFRFSYIYGNGDELVNKIISGQIKIVCDGSYSPDLNLGSTAYRFEDNEQNILAQGACRTPGCDEVINAYRSEVMGLYLILLMLQLLCEDKSIKSGTVLIACDNIHGLFKSLKQETAPSTSSTHFDLFWEIHHIRQKIPLKIDYIHVKGHQSSEERRACRLAEMNHQMDALAKEFVKYCKEYPETQQNIDIWATRWSLWINNTKVVRAIPATIRQHVHGNQLKDLWISQKDLDPTIWNDIDWVALRKANKALSHSEVIFQTKIDSRTLPCQQRLYKINEAPDDLCPICKSCSEDIIHIMACTNGCIQNERHNSITEFIVAVRRIKTSPDIIDTMVRWLLQPNNRTFCECVPRSASSNVQIAAMRQDLMGKDFILAGKISKHWEEAQHEYRMTLPDSESYRKASWSPKFIMNVQRLIRRIWKTRNDKVHEDGRRKALRIETKRLKKAIETEYKWGKQMVRYEDRYLFDDVNCKDLLEEHITIQKHWIANVNAAKLRFESKYQRDIEKMSTDLCTWLGTVGHWNQKRRNTLNKNRKRYVRRKRKVRKKKVILT